MNDATQSSQFIANSLNFYDFIRFKVFKDFFSFCCSFRPFVTCSYH